MKVKVTPRRILGAVAIIVILVVDYEFAVYALGFTAADSFVPPKTYSIIPVVGFVTKSNHTLDGYYDVAVNLNLTTPWIAGYEFLQGVPIKVSVNASVWNSEFNDTRNQLFFGFQSAELWRLNPRTGRSGCETVIKPPFGVNLTRFVNTQAILNGRITKIVEWHGVDTLCFLNQGDYGATFTVIEPHKLPITLLQNAGNISKSMTLTVANPNTYLDYLDHALNRANVFLGVALVVLEIIGSISLMIEVGDKTFR